MVRHMDNTAPESTAETVQVAAIVPKQTATALADLARLHERSTAAELRLAIRAWLEAANAESVAA